MNYHYLSPTELATAIQEHKDGSSDRLAECLYKIASGVLDKHKIKGEARDDLQQEMVLAGLHVAHTVDPDGAAFSYLTTCFEWKMHSHINEDKRHKKIAARYAHHLVHPHAVLEGEEPKPPKPTKPADTPHPKLEEIARLRREGLTQAEIGERVGLTLGKVHLLLRDADVTKGKRPHPMLEEIRRLRAEGLTQAEIGERVGLSRHRIWQIIQQNCPSKLFDENYNISMENNIYSVAQIAEATGYSHYGVIYLQRARKLPGKFSMVGKTYCYDAETYAQIVDYLKARKSKRAANKAAREAKLAQAAQVPVKAAKEAPEPVATGEPITAGLINSLIETQRKILEVLKGMQEALDAKVVLA